MEQLAPDATIPVQNNIFDILYMTKPELRMELAELDNKNLTKKDLRELMEYTNMIMERLKTIANEKGIKLTK